jgi:hypothetical protein
MILTFPMFFTDELLFSVIARFMERMRVPNLSILIGELFGALTFKPVLDFPSHLKAFRKQLPPGPNYPSVAEIIENHTFLPLYAPFLSSGRLEELRDAMRGDEGKAARLRAGIVSSRIPLPRELKTCRDCVREDRNNHGEAFWHRSHQIPEMKVCHLHETPLQKMKNDFVGEQYISAEQALDKADWDESKIDRNEIGKLHDLAVDVNWLLANPQYQTNPNKLYKEYSDCIKGNGYIQTESGKLLKSKILYSFQEYYSNKFLESIHCKLKDHDRSNWLALLVSPSQYYVQTPLHHLLLIRFLGQTAESFFNRMGIAKKRTKQNHAIHHFIRKN